MFSSLMPQRKEFFELLAAHADHVAGGAQATLRLLNGLGANGNDVAALVAEVNADEDNADRIKGNVIELLHRSFTTPINRDQIHTLIIELDLALNALQDVANAVDMYSIRESTTASREMAALGADACLKLQQAVGALADKGRKDEIARLCREIDAIETRGDKVHREAIAGLFDGSQSIWTAIKMREFYELQEAVLDRCEDAAKTLEEILIENS